MNSSVAERMKEGGDEMYQHLVRNAIDDSTTPSRHQRNLSVLSTSGDSAFVEMDPSERYGRFDEELGRGACKIVYKAFDTQEGREVAWNKVDLCDVPYGGQDGIMNNEEQDKILAEIRVLKALKHKNIMSFYKWWYNEKKGEVNFISEMFASGTLRKYRKKHKHLGDDVLKHWGWQILSGLVYLHGHNPPIVHRDLKCDNIFINGADGVVKIGDLGLATMLHGRTAPQSVLGTPEFMAPELYEEFYDDRVDVYAFGMVMLELATLDYPYSECSNAAQIYRKVTLGVRPVGLQKVTCRELADFINTCIAPLDQRPRSRQLLKHPYFASIRSTLHPTKSELLLSASSSQNPSGSQQFCRSRMPTSGGSHASFAAMPLSRTASESPMVDTLRAGEGIRSQRSNPSELIKELEKIPNVQVTKTSSGEKVASDGSASPVGSPFKDSALVPPSTGKGRRGVCRCAATNRCFEFAGKYREDKDKRLLNLRLKIVEPDETSRTVEFEFDMTSDTATSVASEMVGVLELSPEDAEAISTAMEAEITTLLTSLEGQASTKLAEAAAELQQELKDTAIQQATGGEENYDGGHASYPRKSESIPCQDHMASGFESMASFHSMESAQSNGSAMQSAYSSPTKSSTRSGRGSEDIAMVRRINSGDWSQKVNRAMASFTPPEGASRRPSLDKSAGREKTASSPRSGVKSPEGNGRDVSLEKRSLSKLYENLLEVADVRQSSLTPPPPKPPLHPSASKSSLCLSSPASLNGDVDSPMEDTKGDGTQCEKQTDKHVNRQKALDALKAVEMRSLTMLGGNTGNNCGRGVPMASCKMSETGINTASSSRESNMDTIVTSHPVDLTTVDSINNKLGVTKLDSNSADP